MERTTEHKVTWTDKFTGLTIRSTEYGYPFTDSNEPCTVTLNMTDESAVTFWVNDGETPLDTTYSRMETVK